jgi:hypothetical protein
MTSARDSRSKPRRSASSTSSWKGRSPHASQRPERPRYRDLREVLDGPAAQPERRGPGAAMQRVHRGAWRKCQGRPDVPRSGRQRNEHRSAGVRADDAARNDAAPSPRCDRRRGPLASLTRQCRPSHDPAPPRVRARPPHRRGRRDRHIRHTLEADVRSEESRFVDLHRRST